MIQPYLWRNSKFLNNKGSLRCQNSRKKYEGNDQNSILNLNDLHLLLLGKGLKNGFAYKLIGGVRLGESDYVPKRTGDIVCCPTPTSGTSDQDPWHRLMEHQGEVLGLQKVTHLALHLDVARSHCRAPSFALPSLQPCPFSSPLVWGLVSSNTACPSFWPHIHWCLLKTFMALNM